MTNHIPRFCYAAPGYTSTITRKQLKESLLATDGWAFCQGKMCDIKSKHLGAGIYRVWLQERA